VGTTIVGGMLVSTILNLIFIPVLYVIVKSGLEFFSRKSPGTSGVAGAAQF
jgi:HAE1 family hydrophobic/amphiphilic exporter-1